MISTSLTCHVCETTHPSAAAAFLCTLGCLDRAVLDTTAAAHAPALVAAREADEAPTCHQCGRPPHPAWWVHDAEGVEHPACERCATWCPECGGDRGDAYDLGDGPRFDPCADCGGRGTRAAYEARQERRGAA
jgi:hypothetical protein